MHLAALNVLAAVSAKPDPAGLPGSSVAEKLINGLFFYTLLGCLAGLLISVLIWVFSSRAQNYHHAATGRQGTIVAQGSPTVRAHVTGRSGQSHVGVSSSALDAARAAYSSPGPT